MARAEQALGNELGPAGQALAGRVLRRKAQKRDEEEKRTEDTGMSVASRLRQRQEKAREKNAAEKAMGAVDTAAKQGTGILLKMAWLNLIPTFGLSLIYINIHVFLRWIFGENLFCKLGDEWVPKQAKAFTGEAGKLGGQAIGIGEVMILILLDFIAGAIILGALALIVMIVTWMAEFTEAGILKKGWMILKGLWELGWEGMSALRELF